MVLWGPGGAYLPVILHVVAQADEAGLEFLWPQCPAVVLPGVQRQVCKGRCGKQASTEMGEGPGLHAEGRGQGETHVGEGNTVRSDVDKAMAWDSWGRWRVRVAWRAFRGLGARTGRGAEWCRIKD